MTEHKNPLYFRSCVPQMAYEFHPDPWDIEKLEAVWLGHFFGWMALQGGSGIAEQHPQWALIRKHFDGVDLSIVSDP